MSFDLEEEFSFRAGTTCPGVKTGELGNKTAIQFGLFLIDRGRATPEQVIAALDKYEVIRKAFGRAAYERGAMNAQQIVEVLGDQAEEQSESRRRFGELAVQRGYLTQEMVQELLSTQQSNQPRLGDILVQMGVLEEQQLHSELEAFVTRCG